jgi:hypothetical protein
MVIRMVLNNLVCNSLILKEKLRITLDGESIVANT